MYDKANKQNVYFGTQGALQKAISAPLLYKNYSTMPGNKPLTREEFRAYMKERDRKLKAYDTAERQ